MRDEESFEQVRFRDGKVVRDPDSSSGKDEATEVRPGEQTGFSLSIKPGALEVNEPLVAVRDEHGDTITFGARAQADAFAERLSAVDGGLRVQAVAPNDPADVDAYLLADHSPSTTEPASVDGATMTFDVGANLYGTLGEAVITGGPTSPAIEHFVKEDLSEVSFRDVLRVRVTDSEFISFDDWDGGSSRWLPDCRVEARDGWRDPAVEVYWCEIKTGDASFQRTQMKAMRELAKEARVLKIRVLIDDLPKQYSVRVHEVEPNE
jgi:hypothetical protein